MKKITILALGLMLTGCADAAINLGLQLGTDLVGAGVSAILKKSDAAQSSSDQGRSVLVCNPAGEKVVDPTIECHSVVTDQ